jgi:hypothetical protein
MSKATKLAAALSLAGAMLASIPASNAQDLRAVGTYTYGYASGVYGDCYYDPSQICPAGPYAAVRNGTAFGAYAAINGAPYLATAPFFFRGLRGGDWVAIHGSGGSTR